MGRMKSKVKNMNPKDEVDEMVAKIMGLRAVIAGWPQTAHRDGALGGLAGALGNVGNGRGSLGRAVGGGRAAEPGPEREA